MKIEVRKEHAWLARLVGEWTYETEAVMEPAGATERSTGTESVRSLDGVWIVCEGRGELPGGGTARTVMTLGYDTRRRRCVGSFVGTMTTHLWVYDGEVDATGEILTLSTVGPSLAAEAKLASYRDTMEFRGDDQRVLTSTFLADDGSWKEIVRTTYRRVK